MKRYVVQVSPLAADRIADYAEFLAQQSGSIVVAQRWMDSIYAAIDTLDHSPRRFTLAEEDALRDYEIRRLIIGRFLALYTIDDESQTVCVVGFRRGRRSPHADELE